MLSIFLSVVLVQGMAGSNAVWDRFGEVPSEIVRDLRSPWPDRRRRAVARLAELGSPQAWERVLEALEDPDAQVADEAQLRLAGVGPGRVLDVLLGRDGLRSRDDWVALRVAEALGRLEVGLEVDDLKRALEVVDPPALGALAWSVERLQRRGSLRGDPADLVPRLERIATRERDPEARADALFAWAACLAAEQVPKAFRQALHQGLEHRAAVLRAACVRLVAEHLPEEREPLLTAALADPSPGVRRSVIEAAEAWGGRSAWGVLAEALAGEPRPGLRHAAWRALRRSTGRPGRRQAEDWRRWLATLDADWQPAPQVEEEAELGSVSTLAGLHVHSDRVAFLVDLSGSIWNERGEGESRKERLDRQLVELLEGLDPEARFDLVPYTAEPHPWRGELVPADRRGTERAVEWFAKQNLSGPGAFWEAWLLGSGLEGVDTVVVLTDGAPTGGRRWNLELLSSLLLEAHRTRPVALIAVLVDAPRRTRLTWRALAEETGGEAYVLEL